jgi:hypothetical protein
MSSRIQGSINALKSSHQQRVEAFVNLKKGLSVPDRPQDLLTTRVRILLARLAFEEVLEYIIEGLGIDIQLGINSKLSLENVEFVPGEDMDIVETIDGACDVRYVVTKALSLCGVPDTVFQEIVDHNNLLKFADGHRYDQHGKLIKPPDHPKAEIKKMFEALARI